MPLLALGWKFPSDTTATDSDESEADDDDNYEATTGQEEEHDEAGERALVIVNLQRYSDTFHAC
eukprot:SAG31_NODE_879_length_11292_cov_49.116680_3_plen_64_part_00